VNYHTSRWIAGIYETWAAAPSIWEQEMPHNRRAAFRSTGEIWNKQAESAYTFPKGYAAIWFAVTSVRDFQLPNCISACHVPILQVMRIFVILFLYLASIYTTIHTLECVAKPITKS
jgi:hypothetical protein